MKKRLMFALSFAVTLCVCLLVCDLARAQDALEYIDSSSNTHTDFGNLAYNPTSYAITITGPMSASELDTSGVGMPGEWSADEDSHPPHTACAAGVDNMYADSHTHAMLLCVNGGSAYPVASISGSNSNGTILLASATLTWSSIAADDCQEQSVPVTGALTSGIAFASPTASISAQKVVWSARVNSAGSISVRACNVGTSSVTPLAVTWGVAVMQ